MPKTIENSRISNTFEKSTTSDHENIHVFNESSYAKFDSKAIIKASEQGNVIAQVGKKVHPMTEEEANRFLEAARGTRYFTLFALALTSGCRRGELLGLTWDCVHLDRQCIVINKSLAYIKREKRKIGESRKIPILKETKTSSSHRIIPLNKVAMRVLEIARTEQNEDKKIFGDDYKDTMASGICGGNESGVCKRQRGINI